MSAVRKQYLDYQVTFKVGDTVTDTLRMKDLPDEGLTAEQLLIQNMMEVCIRSITSEPYTDYFKNAVRDFNKKFLNNVPKEIRPAISWKVERVNDEGEVFYETPDFVTVKDIQEISDLLKKNWKFQPTGKGKTAAAVKPVEPVNLNLGFMKVKVEDTKKKKA